MFKNWFLISMFAFLALFGSLRILPQIPTGTTPIGMDGADSGVPDDDDPGGPGL